MVDSAAITQKWGGRSFCASIRSKQHHAHLLAQIHRARPDFFTGLSYVRSTQSAKRTSIPIIWQIVQLIFSHCQEPFLARELFHIVQGLWGNDPAILLIELWKLPLRSLQPAQH